MAEPRQSFAFDVSAPVQGSAGNSGGYRASSVQGGNVTVADRSPLVQGGTNFTAGLGDYFDNLMKPALERESRARFVKGMTDQMYAEAGEEIRTGDGILSKIFGPTDYEQGATFYESQNRVASAVQEWSAQEDELKKLPKEEVAKRWAGLMEKTATGDPFVDDVVSQEMLKQAAPMLQSVAKARYKYGQEQVVKAQQTSWTNGATAFQAQAQQFFQTHDHNNKEEAQGFAVAAQNFLDSFQPPAGQDEDSYKKSLGAAFNMMLRNGNGHAATALMQRGILEVLPETERVRAEDQYNRFAERANGESAAQFMDDIDTLQGKLTFGQVTGAEAITEMLKINKKISAYTGFDSEYFDTSDQEGALKGVWSARRAAMEKQEDRAWQLEREDAREDRADQRDARKAEIKAAAAQAAYASKNPGGALAAGAVEKSDLDATIYKGYLENDFAGMTRSFKSGIVASDVKSLIQNTVSSAVNVGYSKEFDGLHQKFEGMVSANAALAKEYFGPQFPAMVNYRRLLTSQTPEIAFAMAFGDDIQYSADTAQISAAKKDVVKWVSANTQPGFLARNVMGRPTLNTSGSQELSNLLAREVAQDAKFAGGNLSKDTLLKGAYDRAINNGSFEQYGRLGWSNRPGTTPLYRLMGMQQEEASQIVESAINTHLKRVGFAAGTGEDEYTIVRGKKDGKETLIVVPGSDQTKTVVLTIDELKLAGRNFRKSMVSPGAKKPGTRKGLLGYGGAGGDFK